MYLLCEPKSVTTFHVSWFLYTWLNKEFLFFCCCANVTWIKFNPYVSLSSVSYWSFASIAFYWWCDLYAGQLSNHIYLQLSTTSSLCYKIISLVKSRIYDYVSFNIRFFLLQRWKNEYLRPTCLMENKAKDLCPRLIDFLVYNFSNFFFLFLNKLKGIIICF